MKINVYALIEPNTLKIRYIGITKQSLQKRLFGHLSDSFLKRDNSRKRSWIISLKNKGYIPIIKLLKVCNSRKEALELENELINKYYIKKRLVNCLDGGKFTKKGKKSAKNLKNKKVYVYNYKGVFLQEYSSIKETSKQLNITYSTIKKCLRGDYKYAKQYQFSYTKQDMPNLSSYSKANWNEVELLDTQSNLITKYPKMTKLIEDLNLQVSSSSVRTILGALNKQYGNKYQLKVNGEWKFSTYYNTGVKIVFKDNSFKTYSSKKELGRELGFKGSFTESQLNKRLKLKYKNLEHILYKQSPLFQK